MPALTYNRGTVTVTPGSPNVAGVGTLFNTSQIRAGDVFELAGLTLSIASVDGNTALTLVRPWPGPALAAQPYEVRFSPDAVRVMAAARTIQDVLASGNLNALATILAGADQVAYFTGPGSVAMTPMTALAREIMAQPTAQAVRTLLGVTAAASAGIRVLGAFTNMGRLPTTGLIIGDAYLVNGTLQIYNGAGWTNAGPIVGPAGADGVQIYQTRAAATSGIPTLNTSVVNVFVRNGVTLEMRQRNVTTVSADPLFPAPATDGWGVTFKMNMNDTFIPVGTIGGTVNALTATFPPALTNTAGTRISLVPILTNTGVATLNGVSLRDMQGELLTAGALIPGRTYLFERMSTLNAWQMVTEAFGRADAQALINSTLTAINSAMAALTATVSDVNNKVVLMEDAPILSDGSRSLIQFAGRDILRMTPTGPRLAGAAAGGGGAAPAGGWAATENAQGQVEYTAQAGKRGINAVDRFHDSGGRRYPTALVDGVTRKATIFSVYGQSNADVTEMNDPLIWNAPPMPNHILMLNDVNGARGGLRGWMGVAAPATSSLIPAREDAVYISSTDSRVQSYATAAAALLNHLRGQPYQVFAVRSHAVGGHPLVGSNTTTGIWKNSEGNYLAQWNNWTQDIRNMRNSLIALGYEIEAVCIFFTHQEADWQLARGTYFTQFSGMKSEREAILAADLPGVPVRWFVDQASGSGLRSGSYQGGAWQSRLAIVDIAENLNNVTMVMPRYTMPFGFNGGTLEDIHHSHYARILQGEAYGHAVRERSEGRQWKCPRMNSATVAGNLITVNFDSLLPIKIDPTFCKVRQDMGFKIGDGSIAVQSVTQIGQRQVLIQCSASPAGQLLAYAWRSQDAQDISDMWPIATGAIRDAWEHPSLFLSGERVLRPAVGYTLQL